MENHFRPQLKVFRSEAPIKEAKSVLDAFTASERSYLLHFIYLGDIRGAAIFATLGAGMAFFFTRQTANIHHIMLYEVLVAGWFIFNCIGFALSGIALCPLRSRKQVPREKNNIKAVGPAEDAKSAFVPSSLTHYLDVAAFTNYEAYCEAVVQSLGKPIHRFNGLALERLKECYQLALILKTKMDFLYGGFWAGGFAMMLLASALILDVMVPSHQTVLRSQPFQSQRFSKCTNVASLCVKTAIPFPTTSANRTTQHSQNQPVVNMHP